METRVYEWHLDDGRDSWAQVRNGRGAALGVVGRGAEGKSGKDEVQFKLRRAEGAKHQVRST